MSFLDTLLDRFDDPHALQDHLFVFPTRRMRYFFRRALARRISRPVLLPETLSIDDLFRRLAPARIAERLELLLPLYRLYHQKLGLKPEKWQPFESFLPWGETMLRDFEEIDKHLIDPEGLFQNLAELEEIEQLVGLSPEQKAAIRRFWSAFSDRALPEFEQQFANVWAALRQTYPAFRQWQEAQHLAYEGLAQRMVVEQLDRLARPLLDRHEAVVFAGFNALTGTEMALLEYVLDAGKGQLYWDADAYYLEADHQEAGLFQRRHQKRLAQRQAAEQPFVGRHFAENEHRFTAIGVHGGVGQVKAASDWLAQLVHPSALRSEEAERPAEGSALEKAAPENIAIVLADESLLIPLLQSLPVQAVNVTMGVTLARTPLFSAFEAYAALLESRDAQGRPRLRELLQALEHPMLRRGLAPVATPAGEAFGPLQAAGQLRQNPRFRVDLALLEAASEAKLQHTAAFLRTLLPAPDPSEGQALLRGALQWLDALQDAAPEDPLERESLHHLSALLRQSLQWLADNQLAFSLPATRRIVRERARALRMPFEGEPLEGVQIMGLLETQGIDFEHVLVLSANEGTLPPSHNPSSFIPYHLRRGYGLPAQEESEAISAHHFFRLLQRARTAALFYDTQTTGTNKGEPSRFIRQIELEMARALPTVAFREQVVEFQTRLSPTRPIAIEKTASVWEKLLAWRQEADAPAADEEARERPRQFSATGLHTFLQCPLKWYFRYIEGLQEEEQVEDKDLVAANRMGDVIHHTLEALYRAWVQQGPLSPEALEEKQRQVETVLDTKIHELLGREASALHGEALLMRQAALQSVRKTLRKDARDAAQAPLEILGLETPFQQVAFPLEAEASAGSPYVWIQGFIDRMDRYQGRVRIIDYKTGGAPEVKLTKTKKGEEALWEDKLAEDCRQSKETFQLRFYDLMHAQQPAEGIPAPADRAYVWPLQKGQALIGHEGMLTQDQRTGFQRYVRAALHRLFDPSEPFAQTDDLRVCAYCDFRRICRRD